VIAWIRVLAAGAALALLAFWDTIHPTTQVASVLGNAWVVASVPEPDTTSLLAIGLLVLALRSSRPR
jgi:phospholipase/lecithinase/hemolysin